MRNMDDMPAIVRDFLVNMETIKGKSTRTINEYSIDLRTFFRFIKLRYKLVSSDIEFKKIDITDVDINVIKKITLSDIYEYFAYISSERLNQSATRARKASSIKVFFNYLTVKKKILDIDPSKELEAPKLKKSLPVHLSKNESIQLLDTIDGNFAERNIAIITLFLNCGLRVSELVGINLSEIKFDERVLIVLGKGNKERIIYLNDACIDALNKYITVRQTDGIKEKHALFISNFGNRISVRTVQWLVKKFIEQAGLDSSKYSVHKLRHTAATLMYQNGVDIRALQEILGHENLGTTQIYTHVSNSALKKAAESHPLANIKTKTKKIKKNKDED